MVSVTHVYDASWDVILTSIHVMTQMLQAMYETLPHGFEQL